MRRAAGILLFSAAAATAAAATSAAADLDLDLGRRGSAAAGATRLRRRSSRTAAALASASASRLVQPSFVPEGGKVRPQVFLLFLVYTKINNQDVWERFLDGAVKGSDYTALVHCKSEAGCRQSIRSHRFEIVPSVETRYCLDLVSGMNALLRAALRLSGVGSPRDKFVFLSDSTLPIKPFSYIYNQLTADTASDFCLFPRNEWAEVSQNLHGGGEVRIAPKHHQWVVLGREHAQESVARSGESLDLMQQLQLNLGTWSGAAGFQNTGCLDEFWHFQTIFRSLQIPQGAAQVDIQDFNGGPLSTTNYEIQGRCDTFVHWVQRATGTNNNITMLAQALQNDLGTDMTPPTDTRPASMQRFGRASIAALRNSPFLFVRKVNEGAFFSGCEKLDEAFALLAFAPTPLPVTGEGKEWRGEGTWLDNRRAPVVITTRDGAAEVSGRDHDMHARGFFCGDHLEVTFVSGYRASATVSADGSQLHWANGVVWPRA